MAAFTAIEPLGITPVGNAASNRVYEGNHVPEVVTVHLQSLYLWRISGGVSILLRMNYLPCQSTRHGSLTSPPRTLLVQPHTNRLCILPGSYRKRLVAVSPTVETNPSGHAHRPHPNEAFFQQTCRSAEVHARAVRDRQRRESECRTIEVRR